MRTNRDQDRLWRMVRPFFRCWMGGAATTTGGGGRRRPAEVTLQVEVNFTSSVVPMRIGEIAKHVGIRPSAVRYYERLGLLRPAVRVNGRRRYDGDSIQQLRLIQLGGRVGFALDELKQLMKASASPKLVATGRRLVERKLDEMDSLIAGASQIRALLAEALKCGCIDLQACTLVQGAAATPPNALPSPRRRGLRPRRSRTAP